MKNNRAVTVSLISVALGLLLGLVVVIITGRSPVDMLLAILKSMTGINVTARGVNYNIVYVLNWFTEVMPLILTGLSVAFAYRTGLFNIGADGQYMMGATAASAVALFVDLPPVIHPIACILAAMVAGAAWGFFPGFLKATRNIHEVVICIMFNYIGLHFSNYLVRYHMPIDVKTNQRTIAFPESAHVGKVVESLTSQFNWGFLVCVIAVFVVWFIIEKTSFGYSLKATGFNKDAANFAGMKVKRNIVLSMMISGALAGAAGAVVVLGVFRYGRIYASFDNYGFNGIPVALVGAANAFGVALASLLFGLLKACSTTFQTYGIPKEISDLIQASIIYLVAIQYGILIVIDKLKVRKEKKLEAVGGDK